MKKLFLFFAFILLGTQTYANDCPEPIELHFDYICDDYDLTIVEFVFNLSGGSGVYSVGGFLNLDMVNEGELLAFTVLGGEQIWLLIEDANGDCEPLYFSYCLPFCYFTETTSTNVLGQCNSDGSFNATIIIDEFSEPPFTISGDTSFIAFENVLQIDSLTQSMQLYITSSNNCTKIYNISGEDCIGNSSNSISVDAINPAKLGCNSVMDATIEKAENTYSTNKK